MVVGGRGRTEFTFVKFMTEEKSVIVANNQDRRVFNGTGSDS